MGYFSDLQWRSGLDWTACWKNKKPLIEGEWYWGMFRNIRTTQERRYSCASEHKPFVRGKRSIRGLPSAWDDIFIHREKTWKARTRLKRQWQTNYQNPDSIFFDKIRFFIALNIFSVFSSFTSMPGTSQILKFL